MAPVILFMDGINWMLRSTLTLTTTQEKKESRNKTIKYVTKNSNKIVTKL